MTAPILRQYQLELVDAVWSEIFLDHTALAVLPTGGGKTVCIAKFMERSMKAMPGIRIAMVMGRIDLVAQTEAALSKVLPRRDIGVYCGTMGRKETSKPITVASIQSIANVDLPHINLLIVDEVQNLDQKGGAYLRLIERTQKKNPKLKIVGFTATPFRSDGIIYGENKLFKRVCYRKTIQDMIAMGFLCRPILKQSENAFDTSKLRIRAGEYSQEDVDKLVSNEDLCKSQIKGALEKMEGRQSIAWACANIDHCVRVTNILADLGEWSTCVHSKQSKEVRSANLSSFMGGSTRHMVFVSVLSEGFDHPPIDCVVLMRPTRSPVLYVQTVGRGLRPYQTKKDCLVLDYGQVVRELGPLDSPKVKGEKGDGEAVLKECPQCHSWVPGGCLTCPDCEHVFPPREKPEDKLTKRADDNAKILSDENKPTTETLGPALISMHESKSGNQCVRITYEDKNLITKWGYGGISEYFVVTSPWAMERLERRLSLLNAQLPSIPFVGIITAQGTYEIVKTKEGKYDRILTIKKIADESPQSARQAVMEFKSEQFADRKKENYLDRMEKQRDEKFDTSFDFGANANNEESIW